ncbi:hypothetical protein LV779_34075 [Streptomyces thinghirensis]|nr:hypothetical protein [Streptomyces thinghirensis]
MLGAERAASFHRRIDQQAASDQGVTVEHPVVVDEPAQPLRVEGQVAYALRPPLSLLMRFLRRRHAGVTSALGRQAGCQSKVQQLIHEPFTRLAGKSLTQPQAQLIRQFLAHLTNERTDIRHIVHA